MTPSIRTFLFINLLLSITLITSLAIIGNMFLEHKDLRDHLDAQLQLVGLTIEAFSNHGKPMNVNLVQEQINKIPQKIQQTIKSPLKPIHFKQPTLGLLQFQIWDQNGNLLLRSVDGPRSPFDTTKNGFSDQWLNGELWRVYTSFDKEKKSKIVVAEKYNFREEVESRITKDSLFMMLITYPFLGLLIWIIVSSGGR